MIVQLTGMQVLLTGRCLVVERNASAVFADAFAETLPHVAYIEGVEGVPYQGPVLRLRLAHIEIVRTRGIWAETLLALNPRQM